MRVLVLLSAAGGGDRQPAIALAVALASRGHEVALLCDDRTRDLVSSTAIPTIINDVPQVGYISTWIAQQAQGEDPPNPFLEWAILAVGSIGDDAARFHPDVIVSSLFCMGLAQLLASRQGVPWCFVNPSFYFGDGQRTAWEADWHGPFVPRLARDCFLPLVDQADLVLHAVDPIFDFEPTHLPERHHYVGFLLWEPNTDAPSLLAEPGPPWALVSASTARPGDEEAMLRSALRGLAGHPVRAILTAPKGTVSKDLSGDATVVGHVPHSLILRKSAISVNQASAGIVSKCLTYGVPMVLVPWDADQPGNAARAEAIGVAVTVAKDSASPETVSSAVGDVLNQWRFRSVADEVAAELRRRSTTDTAVSLVESLAGRTT